MTRSRVLGSGGREQSLVFDRRHDGLHQQPWHGIDQSGRRIAGVCGLNEHIAWLASRVCDVPLRSLLIPSEVPPSRKGNVLPGCGWDQSLYAAGVAFSAGPSAIFLIGIVHVGDPTSCLRALPI